MTNENEYFHIGKTIVWYIQFPKRPCDHLIEFSFKEMTRVDEDHIEFFKKLIWQRILADINKTNPNNTFRK